MKLLLLWFGLKLEYTLGKGLTLWSNGEGVQLGSPTRTRTTDPVINSHLLYQLSYRGIEGEMLLGAGPVVKAYGLEMRPRRERTTCT